MVKFLDWMKMPNCPIRTLPSKIPVSRLSRYFRNNFPLVSRLSLRQRRVSRHLRNLNN